MNSYATVEVTRRQYRYLRKALAGLIFHRKHWFKYYVKPALMVGEVAINEYLGQKILKP